jgi:hypothetical protein
VKLRLRGRLGGFIVRVLVIFHGRFEVADAFSQSFANIAEPLPAKENDNDDQDKKQFRDTDFPHNSPSAGIVGVHYTQYNTRQLSTTISPEGAT